MVAQQAKLAKVAIKYVGGAAVGFFAYKLIQNGYENLRRNMAQKELLNKREGQQAQILKQAMNPSGFDWMMSFDGTHLRNVNAIAKEITDFSTVMNYYSRLYPGRNLVNDLESELNVKELKSFYSALGTAQNANLKRMIKGSSPFKFAINRGITAKGTPMLYSEPNGNALFQLKEINAPLGKVLARVIDANGGKWYMLNVSGKKVFAKEKDLG